MGLGVLLAAVSLVVATPLISKAPEKKAKPQVEHVPFEYPGFGKVAWVVSPNFDARPENTVVDTVVLHHTASASMQSVIDWFSTPESRVSSHYTIAKDGSIFQHVSTFMRAWHAGASRDVDGRERVNDFSIGIEIENAGDGADPFTEAQIQVTGYLIGAMRFRFPELKYVTSHEYIAVPAGRKVDPRGFPWERLNFLGLKLVYGKAPEEAGDATTSIKTTFETKTPFGTRP